MKSGAAVILLAMAGAACVPAGPGTITPLPERDAYVISFSGRDPSSLHEAVHEQALAFCRRKKLHFMQTAKTYDESSYAMTFRCLSAGDPDFQAAGDADTEAFHRRLGGYGDLAY